MKRFGNRTNDPTGKAMKKLAALTLLLALAGCSDKPPMQKVGCEQDSAKRASEFYATCLSSTVDTRYPSEVSWHRGQVCGKAAAEVCKVEKR